MGKKKANTGWIDEFVFFDNGFAWDYKNFCLGREEDVREALTGGEIKGNEYQREILKQMVIHLKGGKGG